MRWPMRCARSAAVSTTESENLIELGEQTVAAQKSAEDHYEKTNKMLTTTIAQLEAERAETKARTDELQAQIKKLQAAVQNPEEAAKTTMNNLFDELASAMGSVCCTSLPPCT
eukprot:COSAG03_NODE_3274_length_2111_cov_2.045726_2_plen_113_part_00